MQIINTRHSEDGTAIATFLAAIVFIPLAIILIIINGWFVIPFMFLGFILPSLFFLDISLWHFWGKEIISITENELEIRKIGRIFKKKKKIKLHQIRELYLYQNNDWYIHSCLAFWDISRQGTLCIKYKKRRKYYIGVNMPTWEANELREKLMQEINKNGLQITPCK